MIDRKNIRRDLLVSVSIIFLPFLFFIYNLIPEEVSVWKTSWFEIDSGLYEQVKYYIWLLFVKTLTLLILSIWFVTCSRKWRITIIIPVIFEIYKICLIIINSSSHFEPRSILNYTLLFSIPYVLMLFLIAKKMKYYNAGSSLKLNKEINNNMIRLANFNLKTYKQVQKELLQLRKRKNKMNKKEYLVKLIELRDLMTIRN